MVKRPPISWFVQKAVAHLKEGGRGAGAGQLTFEQLHHPNVRVVVELDDGAKTEVLRRYVGGEMIEIAPYLRLARGR